MLTRERIKNVPFSRPVEVSRLVRHRKGKVVSRPLARNSHVDITLFALDQGEELGSNAVHGDVMVHVLEGEVRLNIGGKEVQSGPGQMVVMPADVPHTVKAAAPAKLVFTVVC